MDRKAKSAYGQEILNNPLWPELFEGLAQYYYRSFREITDAAQRDRIAMAHDMLDDFQEQLEATVAEGLVVPMKIVGGNENE